MRRIFALLLTLGALLAVTAPAFADAIAASPAEILASTVEPVLPVVLIAAALVVTALLVRHFRKK